MCYGGPATNTNDRWPSIDVIRAELDTEVTIQSQRAEAADARAGVIIGFAGAIATLTLMTGTLATLPGALLAVAAAVAALTVLRPKPESGLEPVALRTQFLAAPELEVKKAALDRRVANYEKNQPVIAAKSARIKAALTLLTVSIVVVVAGEAYHLLTVRR